MTIESPLSEVKGVGNTQTTKLNRAGLDTIGDLLNYFPRRYDDYSLIKKIGDIKPGAVTIKAVIKQARGKYIRRGLHITEAVASDDSSSVRIVWFNQPYRAKAIKPNTIYYISGLFELRNNRLVITNPSMELASNFPINTARIVPIYNEIKGLKSTELRRVIRSLMPVIDNLTDTIPEWIVKECDLVSTSIAYINIHFPETTESIEKAKRRLGFDEVFELSLASLLNKKSNEAEKSIKIPFSVKLAKEFVTSLPFKLTDAQRRAVWEIYQDMSKVQPMNRLLEGDVGSGKTVVATMSALMAMEQDYQVALMAPTEILAQQHAETIRKLLEPMGYGGQVGLLVGSLSAQQKRQAHENIANGKIRLLVGTHAVIQDNVDMHKLGLVIVDEQHRFGVEQRKALQKKAGHMPHILSMTATPIPRSLALTLYGELNITIMNTKPVNRKPVITKVVDEVSVKREHEFIKKHLELGQQMFVVCPTIYDSKKRESYKSVEEVYKQTVKTFPSFKVKELHGKLKPAEKNKIMTEFSKGEIDILVTTTVIEVGVDVPNTSIIMIEEPERFGLAQIHQLRGRVGRGGQQAYCYLVKSDSSPPSHRLRVLENVEDGFKLAEIDLDIRGPGAIYGTLQHGQLDLRIAKLSDTRLIAEARSRAQEFIDKKENLLKYKQLNSRVEGFRAVTNLN